MLVIRPAPIMPSALVASTVPDTPAAYSATTTYAGGALVQDPATHRQYQSVQPNNTGHPLTDLAWWLDAGVTNRWAMFDQTNGSQSTQADALQVDLLIGGRVNAVAILNCQAAYAQIIAKVGGNTVYDKTFSMTATDGINDWFQYFFQPITRRPDLIVTDLPTYSNVAITVKLTRPGGTVAIGTLVVGQTQDLGITAAGMGASIIDYSRKDVDAFGNYIIIQRAFSKKLETRVLVDNTQVDAVFGLLSTLRATPVVWIASGDYATAGVFGFYRNFSVTFDYPGQSLCLLEIEGLT